MKNQINKAEILKYFPTIENAVNFYELQIENLQRDLNKVKECEVKNEIFNIMGGFTATAINNPELINLKNNFIKDYKLKLEEQIKAKTELLKHVKTL